jgi:hypothetical protein
MLKISRDRAAMLGFPANPRLGQVVRDRSGKLWIWPHQAGMGLGDLDDYLGQWVELAMGAASLIGSLFGPSKEDQQKQAAIQQLTSQNAQLQVALASAQASPFQMSKMWLALIAVGVVAFVAFKK